ncbi:MAG: discoidin domain-containing protein, partial [Chthoniobacterales bacterium]
SSVAGANTGALGVDGNGGTRWESLATDSEFIYVDLGATKTIHTVVLTWETACGKDYTIQTTNDAVNGPWTDLVTPITGNTTAGMKAYTGLSGSGRYVRMAGTLRATQWGYSLWEFQVFGTTGGGGSAPVINSALTKSGTVGTALTYNITATNTPTSYNATPLPAGLSINTRTGAITGTPTAAGTTNTTISATNANGTGSATLVFTISAGGDTNLALSQPATASSFQAGNLVANGNDASTTSRWAAVDGTYPQWWRVDLGASKVLSRVDIMWLNPTTRSYKYKIETSPDDATYTTAFDNTGNTTLGDTSNTITATARYVRVTVTGSNNGGFASFYDIKVFGH